MGGGVAERAESALVVGVMALPPVVQAADAVDVVARQDSGIGEQLVAQRTHGHGVRLFQRCRLRRRCRHDPPPSFTDRTTRRSGDPIYKISYDLSYDYRKFIVRSTYDSDLKRAEISPRNILS